MRDADTKSVEQLARDEIAQTANGVRSRGTSPMIERVARAICDVKTHKIVTPDYELPDNTGRKAWELCVDEARAAIEIMMEPTAEMIRAADNSEATTTSSDYVSYELTYKAMLREALKK